MKIFRFLPVLLLISASLSNASGQVLAAFENFGLKPGEYLNNAAPDRTFKSGSIELPNFYDTQFNFWSGWAISADTNVTTPGFLNQYSSIAGEGALGTSAYAVGYIFDPIVVRLQPNAIGKPMIGMYVNNCTYTYLSMRDGDAFAKKFGGETGQDPDFLLLTIKKYAGGAIHDDSINFYLADYRFSQPVKDYLVSDWSYIDLTTMGEVDSLVLRMTSSDVGAFGMNTPAYICIDQVSTDNLLAAATLRQQGQLPTVGPNPATEKLFLTLPVGGRVSATGVNGLSQWTRSMEPGTHQVDVSTWPKGMYVINVNGQLAGKIVVQ